jgi:DNA-directed RNA polymerase subunit K/omega
LNELYLKVSLVNIVTMDESDYYSESGSENDSENEILETKVKTKPLQIKPSINIETDDENDSDIDMEDEDDEDEDEVEKPNLEMDDDDDDDDDVEDIDDEEDDDDDDIELDEEGEPIVQTTVKKRKTEKIKKPLEFINSSENEDYEEDDEDEYDENYLQKFDSEVTKNYVNEFHPECLMHNYDEIAKMSVVIRNSDNIVIDPLHKTIPYLTKYEKARILGQRSKQIESGSKPFVKVPENIIDSYIIAELELREKKIPFIIKRPIPSGGSEYWKIVDLEIIDF